MKTCFIFGSMPLKKTPIIPSVDDLIIAADAGLKNLEEYSIMPNLIVGDFDSLEYTPEGDNVIKHPVKKDETDTILAVDIAFKKGYDNFIIYGCLGGRLDHTMASIQTASYIAEKGGTSVFVDDETYLTVIKENKITFSEENKGIISVFAISDIAVGVNISNLLYSLENADLSPDFPLGVSNEFIGKPSTISVKIGKICIIWNTQAGKYTIGD